jgi:hypothetical protein
MEPLKIVVRGRHDSGKTSVANLIKMALEEAGFLLVAMTLHSPAGFLLVCPVKDTKPLPTGKKAEFQDRLHRNMVSRPIQISVELED